MAKDKKIALDLKHFKHVKSDDHTTTLQHKNGHMLTLAHKSLHPDAQAQLSALSKIAKAAATDEQSDEMKHKMSYGGEVRPNEKKHEEHKPKEKSQKDLATEHQQHIVNHHEEEKGYFHKDTKKELKKLNKMKGYADGGDVSNPQADMLKTVVKLAPLLIAAEGGEVKPQKEAKYCMYCGGMAHGGECVEQEMPEMASKPFADGGKVNRDKNIEGARAVKEDAQKGGPTLAQGWENIKSAFRGEGPKYQAEGGEIQQDAPDVLGGIGESIDKAMYTPAVKAVPDDVQATRDIYNQMVARRLAPGQAANKLTPEEQMMSVKPFQFQPGSNEAPKDFDADAWKQAAATYQATQNQKALQGQKDAVRQQSMNTALQQAGVDVVPGAMTVPPQIVPQASDRMPNSAPTEMPSTAVQNEPQSHDPMDQYGSMLQQGYQNQMAGIQAGAKAQEQLGQQESNVLQQQVQADQVAKQAFQDSYKDLEQERRDTIEDIRNNFINPEHYWENHSKIAAGIGMILAGFNPAGKPNAAIEFINNQINRDMEAQAKNLQARDNLLSHNLQQFGNLRNAAEMTRLQMLDMVNHQIGVAAAQAKGPMAKAAALQAMGQLQQQMAPLQMNLAVNRAMMRLQNSPNGGMPPGTSPTAPIESMLPMLRIQRPEMAKEIEGRLIPGVGLASTTVPQQTRDQVQAMNVLDAKGRDLLAYARAHKGSVDPKVWAVGKQKAEEMLNYYNNSIQGGVLTEGRLKWLDDQIKKNPTNVFQDILGNNAKLEEIINSNDMRKNSLLKSVGINAPAHSAQMQPEQGAAVTGRDGRQYVKQVIKGKAYYVPVTK